MCSGQKIKFCNLLKDEKRKFISKIKEEREKKFPSFDSAKKNI